MALAIIGLVLLQQGKGADMGAAFGAGAAGAVFGARGGGSFFTRATAILATGFFINSVLLSSPLVREVQDGSATVTATVPVPSGEAPVEQKVDTENIDLPPADLPEAATPAEDAAAEPSDLPDVPVTDKADTAETGSDAEASGGAEKSDSKQQ